MNKVHFRVFALFYFAKDRCLQFFSVRQYELKKVEAATASNILICDYLVSQGKELLNLITVVSKMCGKHSHDQQDGKR